MELINGNVIKEVHNEKEIADYVAAGWKVKENKVNKLEKEIGNNGKGF